MLRELPKKSHVPDQPQRRWFFSQQMDLIVWVGSDGQPTAFQLAYDKYRGEHLVSWSVVKGIKHYVVDDGESGSGSKQTPLLHANGAINGLKVLAGFRAEAIEIPAVIRDFVEARLQEIDA